MLSLGGPSSETAVETSPPEIPQPLSKNAQKKLVKAARIAEQKKERRAYEKERRKEKKRQLAEKRAAGEIDEEEEERRKKRARTEGPKKPFQARIVVDLGFDDMMTENEVKSLTSQLAYTYSANRKASQPFAALLFTSLNGKTYTRLESQCSAAYKRWHDTEWWTEGYEKLWTPEERAKAAEAVEALVDTPGPLVPDEASASGHNARERDSKELSTAPFPVHSHRANRDTVVYLTADSTDELTELKEGETYIIGGICDHNRYKNLCFNKSKDTQIRSARLPIGTYLAELRTRKVLTVNQTFEILLKWVETKDWRQAFETVVPKRKLKDTGNANDANSVTENIVSEDAMIVNAAAVEDAIPEEELATTLDGEVDTVEAVYTTPAGIAIVSGSSDTSNP